MTNHSLNTSHTAGSASLASDVTLRHAGRTRVKGPNQVRFQRGFGLLLSLGLLGSTLLSACADTRKLQVQEVGEGKAPDAGDKAHGTTPSTSGMLGENSGTSVSSTGGNSSDPTSGSGGAMSSSSASGDGTDSGETVTCEESDQSCASPGVDAGGGGDLPNPTSSDSASTSTSTTSSASVSATGSAGNGMALLASAITNVNLKVVEVGTLSSPPAVWKIENRGGAASGVPVFTNSNETEVLLSSNTCTAPIPPGGFCEVAFGLRASGGGNRGAQLTVSDPSSGTSAGLVVFASGGRRITITVVGGGTGASVVSNPAGIDCGSTCTAVMSGNVTLTAATTNGSNLLRTGWSGATNTTCGKAPVRDCAINANDQPLSITVTFKPLTQNLIFGTSKTSAVAKGSAPAFDADCNAAATAGGVNNAAGDDFMALVSDSTSSVRTRLGATARGWVRMDGAPFADSQTSLFTDRVVYNPVLFDELGRRSTNTVVITGTTSAGAVNSTGTCENWTINTSALSWAGGTTDGGPGSWLTGGSGGCQTNSRLFCMSKSRTTPVTVTPVTGRRIWLSNTVFSFGGTTPDQHCQAERPTGVTKARALIATTTQTAASVLDAAVTYVRPDGILVGTGAQLATITDIASGIWQMADLSYGTNSTAWVPWTGQTKLTEVGTVDSTCNDWTLTTGTGRRGISYSLTNWWDTTGSNAGCNVTARLYCVEVP